MDAWQKQLLCGEIRVMAAESDEAMNGIGDDGRAVASETEEVRRRFP